MCLASTHLSSSSSSRLTVPTTGGPWNTSAVYSCTSEAPARIFSRASWPLLTPPTPMMGTWPEGRAPGQAGTGSASRRPQPCCALTLSESIHVPDGLCGELPQGLPAEAAGLRALPAAEAAGPADRGVAHYQPIHTELQGQ